MQAFNNDQEVKDEVIARIQGHQQEQDISNAISCTTDSSNPRSYHAIGISHWVAYLENILFGNMGEERKYDWPLELVQNTPLGYDFADLKIPLLIYLTNLVKPTFDPSVYENVHQSIDDVIEKVSAETISNSDLTDVFNDASYWSGEMQNKSEKAEDAQAVRTQTKTARASKAAMAAALAAIAGMTSWDEFILAEEDPRADDRAQAIANAAQLAIDLIGPGTAEVIADEILTLLNPE